MADSCSQIAYVLTNPAMPGLVKIGKTTQLEVKERMKQLYGTGVPEAISGRRPQLSLIPAHVRLEVFAHAKSPHTPNA